MTKEVNKALAEGNAKQTTRRGKGIILWTLKKAAINLGAVWDFGEHVDNELNIIIESCSFLKVDLLRPNQHFAINVRMQNAGVERWLHDLSRTWREIIQDLCLLQGMLSGTIPPGARASRYFQWLYCSLHDTRTISWSGDGVNKHDLEYLLGITVYAIVIGFTTSYVVASTWAQHERVNVARSVAALT